MRTLQLRSTFKQSNILATPLKANRNQPPANKSHVNTLKNIEQCVQFRRGNENATFITFGSEGSRQT